MEVNESVYELITTLCHNLWTENSSKPISNYDVQKCRKIAYDILLKKSIDVNTSIDPIKELSFHKFEMKLQAREWSENKKCDEFDYLFENLTTNQYFTECIGRSILTFLVCLRNTSNEYKSNEDTKGSSLFPLSWIDCGSMLQAGLGFFQEISSYKLKNNPYILSKTRESSMFEHDNTILNSKQIPTINCDSPSTSFFSLQEENIPITSFLPTTLKYCTDKKLAQNFSDTNQSRTSHDSDGTTRIIMNYNWENLGYNETIKEKYFTSETESMLHLCTINEERKENQFSARIVTLENFLRDIKSLTIGIRSESFLYDDTYLFSIVRDLTIINTTPIALKNSIKELLECGTCFKRLQTMTEKNVYNFKHIYDGFVFKALCTSVNTFLSMFSRFVISFHDKTLLQFKSRIKNLSYQLMSLAKILEIHPQIHSEKQQKTKQQLPIGSDFLGYLYKEIIQVTRKDLSMLYIFILRKCCNVYFKNFQKWIFNGNLDDPSKELFIYHVDNYRINTKTFFDKAYLIRRQSVPGFLQGYEEDILLCGKYTMLLKSFKPQHSIFSLKSPSLSVCLSFKQIQQLELECFNYLRKCYEVCGEPITVKQIFLKRRLKHKQFLDKVEMKFKDNLNKWHNEQLIKTNNLNKLKQQQLLELKQQIKDMKEQKLANRMANIELEKIYIQNGIDAEERQLKIERLETKKRIEFYEELNRIIEIKDMKLLPQNNKNNNNDINTSNVVNERNEKKEIFDIHKNVDNVMLMSQEGSENINTNDETSFQLNVKIPEENFEEKTTKQQIKKSKSDDFNCNNDNNNQTKNQTELNRNKEKILGSKIGEFFDDQQQQRGRFVTSRNKKMTTIKQTTTAEQTEAQKNKIKILAEEFHSYINCDNCINITDNNEINSIDKNSNLTELQMNRNKILGHHQNNFQNETENILKEAGFEILDRDNMSDLEKNKQKIMSSEFNINHDDDEDVILIPSIIKYKDQELTDLEKNRNKVMSQEFNIFDDIIVKPKLNLNLNLERVRNKKKILECEFNIVTGEQSSSTAITPMSTGSDTPHDDDNDDIKNGNIPEQQNLHLNTSLLVPNKFGVPDTAALEKITPESALNTAGLLTKDGFKFPTKCNSDAPTADIEIINNTDDDDDFQKFYETIKRRQCNFFPLQMLHSKNFQFKNNDNNDDIDQLTIDELKNINVTTLTKFLQMSVIIPLNTHMEIINNEILKVFLIDLEIFEHFKCLRNYFFMMNGEFGSNICNGLISRLELGVTPKELMNFQTLHIILENALGNTILINDKNLDKLSFSVDQEIPEKFDLKSPNVLYNLTLTYRVQWPLNLLLNNETLEQYSNVFRYLLKVRRISWLLDESFHLLKISLKLYGKELRLSSQYLYVQQLRHKLLHFVMTLQNHITSNALQAAWKLFKDDLINVKTMDDLYRKHINYIKRILFLCMLNKKSIDFYNTIEDIFKIIIRFCRHLKSRQWRKEITDNNNTYIHPKFIKMEQDERDFEKLIKYTIYLGNKIVRHGYQTEIGEFINLININNYYDKV